MESAISSRLATSELSPEEVNAQLERILSSERVNLPERARRFLSFVVSETLAGRSHYLKAYTIADVVFGRRNFDAQGDPAVRIEAGRIRRELERYYLMAGPSEPVIITIPKGGYVPTFERGACLAEDCEHEQPAPESEGSVIPPSPSVAVSAQSGKIPSRTWLLPAGLVAGAFALALSLYLTELNRAPVSISDGRASIAVDRFDYPTDDKDLLKIAQGTTDEVIAKLVKFKEIMVIDAAAEAEDSKPSSARYMLEGSLRKHGDKIRSSARLVRQSDKAVIWASNYDTDLSIQSMLEAETAVAEKIAMAVAQPFGVIFSTDTTADGGWEAYDCALTYYSYRRAMTKTALATTQECLTSLTTRFPRDATSLAMLSLTNIDQVRFAYKLGTPPPKEALDTASQLAKRAFTIDPQNARVLQALMLSAFFNNDIPAALEAGAASYALNPNDTEVVGEYGLRLSMSGKWETGCDLVSKAVSNGAGPYGYYEVGMALCAFMRGDLQAAELWARMSDLTYNPMHRMVLASILGASGKTVQAREELNWLNTNAPALMPGIRREVSARLARPEDQDKIFSGLRAAGATITETPLSN